MRLRFIPTHVGETDHQSSHERLQTVHPPRMWGKRPHRPSCGNDNAVHPHACGGNFNSKETVHSMFGSSPRMWGKRRREGGSLHLAGRFIPTHVGETYAHGSLFLSFTVHPHACGGNCTRIRIGSCISGSSPRMWGKLQLLGQVGKFARFIPTHVGETLKKMALLLAFD